MKAFSFALAALLLFFCSTAFAQQEKLDPAWNEYNAKMVEAFGKEDFAAAKEYGEKALEYLKKKKMTESLETATTLNNLGLVFYASRDLPRAAGNLVQALALRRKLLGPDHLEVGVTYRNLAAIYQSQAAAFLHEAERIQALHE